MWPFSLRNFFTGYDINTGKRLWRAYSMGPDSDMLVDPNKTMSLGKPIGKDSSLNTWNGDQWKLGGGSIWGYFSYDPNLNLVYYGTGNPSTWNPAQRAGPDGKQIDQKWSMTLMARKPEDGMAAWFYQMTPFDEWDYDGVNENILVDMEVAGSKQPVLVHFDRINSREAAEAARGRVLWAEPMEDPDVVWAHDVIGATVVDQDGTDHGEILAMEANPASDLLVLENGGLVPVRFVTDVEQGREPLQLTSGDLASIQGWISENSIHKNVELPRSLTAGSGVGCRVMDWKGESVALACFRLRGGKVAHLLVIDRKSLLESPDPGVQYVASLEGMNTAAWSGEAKTFLLVSSASKATLQDLL